MGSRSHCLVHQLMLNQELQRLAMLRAEPPLTWRLSADVAPLLRMLSGCTDRCTLPDGTLS